MEKNKDLQIEDVYALMRQSALFGKNGFIKALSQND